jgi:RimJ/RimL family protein N-acetyltransferase
MTQDPCPRTSPRLLLRRFQASDLAAFQIYRHDPQVQRYQGWQAQNDELASAFLQEMAHTPFFPPGKWLQIAVALRDKDYLIGDIGIFAAEDGLSAELGFTFATQYQGQGYASEAVAAIIALLFAHTAITHINAAADADNHPSWRLMERVGMQRIRTEAGTFRNQPCVDHYYRILRPLAP